MTSKAHAFNFLHLRNQHQWRWIFYIQRYENNNMKIWRIKVNVNLLFNQFNSSFSQFSVVIVKRFSVSTFAINQNRSINKNSKSSNSKNLKQHTFAKSISFCCFDFCYCSVRKIDRFIVLICKCLLHRSKSKFSSRFSFSRSSHIFFCLRTSSAFAFIFSRLSHLFWISQFQQWFVTISTFQSMNIFAMSIDQKKWNSRFETKFEEEKRIVLRACLKSRLKDLILSTKVHIEISESLTHIVHKTFRFSCRYLLFKSNILVMLFVF